MNGIELIAAERGRQQKVDREDPKSIVFTELDNRLIVRYATPEGLEQAGLFGLADRLRHSQP